MHGTKLFYFGGKWASGQVDEWASGQVDEWTSGQVGRWTGCGWEESC